MYRFACNVCMYARRNVTLTFRFVFYRSFYGRAELIPVELRASLPYGLPGARPVDSGSSGDRRATCRASGSSNGGLDNVGVAQLCSGALVPDGRRTPSGVFRKGGCCAHRILAFAKHKRHLKTSASKDCCYPTDTDCRLPRDS